MKRNFSPSIIVFMLYCFTSASVKAGHGEQVIVAGWLETVTLAPWQVKLTAKLDSGAKTSSIHAEKVERFEYEGKEWVRFTLPKGKRKNSFQPTIETPLVREVSIKRHNLPSTIRPVVKMAFCLDRHYYKTEFTLTDRSKFNYPVLLGRRFLKNNILVDSASTFMHSNKNIKFNCSEQAAIKADKKLTPKL